MNKVLVNKRASGYIISVKSITNPFIDRKLSPVLTPSPGVKIDVSCPRLRRQKPTAPRPWVSFCVRLFLCGPRLTATAGDRAATLLERQFFQFPFDDRLVEF